MGRGGFIGVDQYHVPLFGMSVVGVTSRSKSDQAAGAHNLLGIVDRQHMNRCFKVFE